MRSKSSIYYRREGWLVQAPAACMCYVFLDRRAPRLSTLLESLLTCSLLAILSPPSPVSYRRPYINISIPALPYIVNYTSTGCGLPAGSRCIEQATELYVSKTPSMAHKVHGCRRRIAVSMSRPRLLPAYRFPTLNRCHVYVRDAQSPPALRMLHSWGSCASASALA